MYFSFHNINPIVWTSVGVAVVASIYLLTVYRWLTCIRYKEHRSTPPDEELPGISVIIYTRDNASDLRRMLPAVLAQEYPAGKIEVIVVNDGSVEDVTDVVNYLGQQHRNLYITFVPDEAHNLSRKKLAVSLGIKAAKNPVVLLTTAECVPSSLRWAREMAAPFTAAGGSKQIALGWGCVEDVKPAMLRFDMVARGATWLSAALHAHPYRGIAFNLAYTRDVFFNNKGFSRSLNLHSGDDDIFISEIARDDNTAVVLSPDARMEAHFKRPEAAYRDLRLRHCFTERKLPTVPRRMMGLSTIVLWLWVAAIAVGCTFSLPNWWPACGLLALIPAVCIPLTVNWLRTGNALGIKLTPALVWWEMLWRWIPNLKCKMSCGSRKRRNFTWLQK